MRKITHSIKYLFAVISGVFTTIVATATGFLAFLTVNTSSYLVVTLFLLVILSSNVLAKIISTVI